MPSMLLLEEMAQGQVASLEFASTLVILPISPLEEHGPHLPVGTDVILSAWMARELGRAIEERWAGTSVVLCPCIPLGAMVVPGPGSVSTGQRAIHDLVFDFLRSLSRSGFRYVLLCNAHGGIGQIIALEEAAERAGRELGIRVEPALSRVIIPFLRGDYRQTIEERQGRKLSQEERDALVSDCHGGQWETGAMLLARPDLVGEHYANLPPVLTRSWFGLRNCMRASCAQGLGYVGAPSFASAEYARAAAEVMQEKVMEQVDAMLHHRVFRPSHTFFYYWPGYRTRKRYTGRQVRRIAMASLLVGAATGVAGALITRRHG